MMEIKNAEIGSTFFGIEDHGMMTFFLHLRGEGWGQGFGGYNLGAGVDWPKVFQEIFRVFGVNCWEDLIGQFVRVRWPKHGDQPQVGHLLKDEWIDLKELIERHKAKAA